MTFFFLGFSGIKLKYIFRWFGQKTKFCQKRHGDYFSKMMIFHQHYECTPPNPRQCFSKEWQKSCKTCWNWYLVLLKRWCNQQCKKKFPFILWLLPATQNCTAHILADWREEHTVYLSLVWQHTTICWYKVQVIYSYKFRLLAYLLSSWFKGPTCLKSQRSF